MRLSTKTGSAKPSTKQSLFSPHQLFSEKIFKLSVTSRHIFSQKGINNAYDLGKKLSVSKSHCEGLNCYGEHVNSSLLHRLLVMPERVFVLLTKQSQCMKHICSLCGQWTEWSFLCIQGLNDLIVVIPPPPLPVTDPGNQSQSHHPSFQPGAREGKVAGGFGQRHRTKTLFLHVRLPQPQH